MANRNKSKSNRGNWTKSKNTSRKDKRPSHNYTKGRNGSEENVRPLDTGDNRGDSRANDPAWYTHFPELIEAAGKFPYVNRPGSLIEFVDVPGSTREHRYVVPGVMALDWMPSVGNVSSPSDPINIAGKELYAKIRKAYSSNLDADAPDLIIYMMALDSVYSYIAFLKRVYRILNVYRPDNYDMPDSLLRAMGFSAEEVINLRVNKTQLWQMINELILQSRKFTCPNVMDVMNRHYWMSDNVYTDDASWNSQFYMFNLAAVYKYSSTAGPGSDPTPGLEAVKCPWVGNPAARDAITPTTLYYFGVDLLNAMIVWDDSYTINGYFMRAFEGTPNFIVEEISAESVFEATYSPEVLTQIENSMTVPGGLQYLNGGDSASNLNVWQQVESNAIVSIPAISVPYSGSNANYDGEVQYQATADIYPYINVRSQLPNSIENVIATRLKAYVTIALLDNNYTVNIQCGTEIPFCWRMLTSSTFTVNPYHQNVHISQSPIWFKDYMTNPSGSDYNKYFTLSAFDWHPTVFVAVTSLDIKDWVNPPENSILWFNIIGDIHNATVVRDEDIKNLHKMCLYSEFNAFGIQ